AHPGATILVIQTSTKFHQHFKFYTVFWDISEYRVNIWGIIPRMTLSLAALVALYKCRAGHLIGTGCRTPPTAFPVLDRSVPLTTTSAPLPCRRFGAGPRTEPVRARRSA